MLSFKEFLEESIVKAKVSKYRLLKNHGKKRFRFTSTRPGYRVKMVNGRPKEIKMSGQQIRRFHMAAMKRKRNPAFKRKQALGRKRASRFRKKKAFVQKSPHRAHR